MDGRGRIVKTFTQTLEPLRLRNTNRKLPVHEQRLRAKYTATSPNSPGQTYAVQTSPTARSPLEAMGGRELAGQLDVGDEREQREKPMKRRVFV